MSENNEQVTQATQVETPQLSISDLQLVLNFIELISQRGVLKGPELSAVGQLYDRIDTFVKSYTEAKSAEDTSSVDSSADQE